MTNIFEGKEFQTKFNDALKHYGEAIEQDTEVPAAAREFMASIFNSDLDAAFAYTEVLENSQDSKTAKILQNIVFNSNVA